MNGEAITLQVMGMTLHALAFGPADGVPTLAMHGWLDNAATFTRLAPLLPGLRIVALDMPGHGLSDHRHPSAGYHFFDMVGDVSHVADALGWDRFALLGHSMGAGVSSLVAGTFPERIVAAMLIEGFGPWVEAEASTPERLRETIEEERKRLFKGDRRRVFATMEEAAERAADVQHITIDAARILCSRGVEEVSGGFAWRADPRLRLPSRLRLTENQVRAFLGRITAPTILVQAASGWPFAADVMKQRLECVQGIRHVALPGGHHLHLDDPGPTAQALRAFLHEVGIVASAS